MIRFSRGDHGPRITPQLETVYLALASLWLFGLGSLLIETNRGFGYFTLIVGGFTALDFVYSRERLRRPDRRGPRNSAS